MIIVTGGSGFIGSNIVKALNNIEQNNILIVDNLANGTKFSLCILHRHSDKKSLLFRSLGSSHDASRLEHLIWYIPS